MDKTVAFVVACVDCRHHVPEAQMVPQLKEVLGVDDVYLSTTAGPDGVCCTDTVRFQAVAEDLKIIKGAKNATVFALLGHYGCAGHNVPDKQHDVDTRRGAELLSEATDSTVQPLIFQLNGSDGVPTWGITQL